MTGRFRVNEVNETNSLISNISVDSTGNIIWTQQQPETMNSTINDTTVGEDYETADEDNTQYLSVLDATNISLDQLNLTLTNPKMEPTDEPSQDLHMNETLIDSNLNDEQKVVVFSVEGSDELYGMQIAQNPEDGSLQKYQFQLRQNEDGQLEAIPETIQLVPNGEELDQAIMASVMEQEVQTQQAQQGASQQQLVIIQQSVDDTNILPDSGMENEQEENIVFDHNQQEDENDNDDEEEERDVKPTFVSIPEFVKRERLDQPEAETYSQETESIHYENINQEARETSNQMELHFEEEDEPETEYFQQEIDEQMFDDGSKQLTSEDDRSTGQYVNGDNLNESDLEDYQNVEGVHITGQDLIDNDELTYETIENPVCQNSMNILKNAIKQREIARAKKDNKMYVYVVQHSEKENVESAPQLYKSLKNPRSILKSSHVSLNESELLDQLENKRFARGKEAMQAKSFNNFINTTTIPQAPVRKDRLPRKQKIKPVDRQDEEIVVQEVMVSSNGFEEIDPYGNKENFASFVTAYVDLTDSDEEHDSKRTSVKRKRGRKKKIPIEISDDDSDSVIELDETDDEEKIVEKHVEKGSTSEDSGSVSTPSKRKRGRPPKNKSIEKLEEKVLDSPMKKMRLDEQKPEFPCTKCDKTFPSQSSLKTHMHHHNLQTTLNESKYKCSACSTNFKNSILLQRHVCKAKEKRTFLCLICKKRFLDATSLSKHKRVHVKDQLAKSTLSVVSISPKKIRSSLIAQPKKRASTVQSRPSQLTKSKTFKSPSKFSKCTVCNRMCSSQANLAVHMKIHKDLVCGTCEKAFVSRLMLDRHVRDHCVKSPSVRRSMRKKGSETPSKLGIEVTCEDCKEKFSAYQEWFRHRVTVHGVETPDKRLKQEAPPEKKERRQAHGGIPAGKKLSNVFAQLRNELSKIKKQ